jgi:hypothetical protein
MGIFNFFKKLVKEKEIEEIVLEKLTFSEIEGWLENKKKENEIREREILVIVQDKIKNFNKDIRAKIVLLKEFDVEIKKEQDKIKEIVNNGRIQYIEEVENLLSNLENLSETKLFYFIKKVDKIFFDFNRLSCKNYERATILIGKEMVNIREGLKIFSNDLMKIFNKNKDISELSSKIKLIKSKLILLGSIEKNMTTIKEIIVFSNDKINQREKENKEFLNQIEKIKQGGNYKNMLEKKEKIIVLEKESKEMIFSLKQFIDFKALANFFHINPQQMAMLKDYQENFYIYFLRDNGKLILSLLDESKLNNSEIIERIEKIYSKLEGIKKDKQEMKKDETLELYLKVKEIILEIDYLKIESVKEKKRNEKLEINKGEVVNELKQKFVKLNVELVYEK